MAPPRGTTAKIPHAREHSENILSAFGRLVGFAALAGLALTILAGVVLLPAYARVEEAQYQRDCLQAGTADAESLIAVNERLIDALDNDEVLAKRLARSQYRWRPVDETTMANSGPPFAKQSAEALATITSARRPAKPNGWLLQIARRFQTPAKRRGLLLVAAVAMFAAMLLAPRQSTIDAKA
jgi:hypothetical protein